MEKQFAEHIDAWVDHVNEHRADKRWTPKLFAPPHIAEAHEALGGMTVHADPSLKDSIVLRCDGDVADGDDIVLKDGAVMATYQAAEFAKIEKID